jgi:hypothetical protein
MIVTQEEPAMTDHEHFVSLSEFVRDASRILDELQATSSEILLEDHGKLFRIAPKQTTRRRKRFDRQDPLFALGGAFPSTDETDIANDN